MYFFDFESNDEHEQERFFTLAVKNYFIEFFEPMDLAAQTQEGFLVLLYLIIWEELVLVQKDLDLIHQVREVPKLVYLFFEGLFFRKWFFEFLLQIIQFLSQT